MRISIRIIVFIASLCMIAYFNENPVLGEQEKAEARNTLPLSYDIPLSDHPLPSDPEPALVYEEAPADSGPPSTYDPGSLIPCTAGLLVYYNQADPRWGDALYGTSDPMRTHGCGPTAIAMIISSFTNYEMTPPEAAQWSSDHGYYSRGEGSRHALIPNGLMAYGLEVTSIQDRSINNILDIVRSGKIIVALMNKGYFTNGGHFLLLTQVTENGKLRIADPANWENSNQEWEPEFILNQVRRKADAGGPLWAVGMPPEN